MPTLSGCCWRCLRSGCSQQQDSRQEFTLVGAFSEAAKTDLFFIIRFCLVSIFAGLKFLARCDVLLSQRRLWILHCSYHLWGLSGLNVRGKDRSCRFILFFRCWFRWQSLSRNDFSVFVFFWWFGWARQRHTANHVTFIFTLKLEHSCPPCRIQNWSLTFSLVPSLARSHFLSIWFLAPYATFLFPACRQQGVALLSPSQSCLWMWEAIPFHSAIGRRRRRWRRTATRRRRMKKQKKKAHPTEHRNSCRVIVQLKVKLFASTIYSILYST